MKRMKLKVAIVFLFAASALRVPQSAAGSNLIVNGSFEAQAPDSTWAHQAGGSFPNPEIVPLGWSGTGVVNLLEPSTVAYPGPIPDGVNVGILGDDSGPGVMWQDVSATLTAGTTYTVDGFIGNRADDIQGSAEIYLLAHNGDVLADSGSVATALGTFKEVNFQYTAPSGSPDLGQALRVQLGINSGSQMNFDVISLTATPEPASLSLLLAGGLALLRRRTRAAR